MAAQNCIMFEGKEFPLWTEKQLDSINRAALKSRAMSIRDTIGADRLPPLPRHPEAMVAWVLDVQSMLSGGKASAGGGGPPSAYGGRPQGDYDDDYRGQAAPQQGRRPGGPGSMCGDSVSGDQSARDAQQAYVDSKVSAMQAKQRNMGGEMAGIMGR
eukprot:TRINITY_DN5245_c0_g1_i1.p1 TRINITY_DN5245_c0_g1~~TRINITY_DN5245_c0_g1_i1.p1  ORF type:complete len:157 (-),score=40.50 TRINITY_DN5245_c0_g1_i1:590-1060(-)